VSKQRDKAEGRAEKAASLHSGLHRTKRLVKYIRKGRKNAKRQQAHAQRRVDTAVVREES
jgi:hypothetical protein